MCEHPLAPSVARVLSALHIWKEAGGLDQDSLEPTSLFIACIDVDAS